MPALPKRHLQSARAPGAALKSVRRLKTSTIDWQLTRPSPIALTVLAEKLRACANFSKMRTFKLNRVATVWQIIASFYRVLVFDQRLNVGRVSTNASSVSFPAGTQHHGRWRRQGDGRLVFCRGDGVFDQGFSFDTPAPTDDPHPFIWFQVLIVSEEVANTL